VPLNMKLLGTVAALGILLIFVGLVVAATPVEVECVYCDGTGKTDCLLCENGRDDCVMCTDGSCDACNGAGGETCTLCGGTGVRSYGTCIGCGGTGWEDCYSCGGTGDCSYCGGKGWETCTFCNGRGWNTCTLCNGEGRTMQVGALLIPGGIMSLIGILLVPTAFIVSRETEKPPTIPQPPQ